MQIWQKKCLKMPLIALTKHLRSSTLRRISLHSSKRNSTRSTIQLGTASSEETSVLTSLTKPSILFTSTWDKLPFFSSSQVDIHARCGSLLSAEKAIDNLTIRNRYYIHWLSFLCSHCFILDSFLKELLLFSMSVEIGVGVFHLFLNYLCSNGIF